MQARDQQPQQSSSDTTKGGASAVGASASGASSALRGMSYDQQVAALAPVQMKGDGGGQTASVHAAASAGVATSAGALPYQQQIQRSFGHHDVGDVKAHTGAAAGASAAAMGAEAYATGDHVVFNGAPSLHTAAHEAAHTVQQRAGVQLSGGVGAAGDRYEQHADAVADRVVKGQSAADLLDQVAPSGQRGGGRGVQGKNLGQAKKAAMLSDNGKRAIIGSDLSGNVYTTTAGEQADRTSALTMAATVSGTVGARVEGMDFTTAKTDLDKESVGTIDPFHVAVTVPFEHDEKKQSLSLLFQHAPRFTGYVTALKDTSNAGALDATMFEAKVGKKGGAGPLKTTDKYSNIHDTKDSGNIAAMTEGKDEKNLDAYTKIAGEGARWLCVRRHASKVTNGSLFFSAHPTDKGKVIGVRFQKLWLRWAKVFGKRYNIADNDVVAALGGGLSADRVVLARTSLSDADYDLDTSKSYVPTPSPTTPTKKEGSNK